MASRTSRIRLFAIWFALQSLLSTGCTTIPKSAPPKLDVTGAEQPGTNASDAATPAVRFSRYTLVELIATPAQRDLMRQIVEITVPPNLDATVGDALHYVLLRSGYRLCANVEATTLYKLPLPAAHLHLGPLTLRDALLTLAGPAWDLSVDDAFRQVCFAPQAPTPTLEVQP